MIHEDDEPPQVGVPVNGGAPVRVRVGSLPGNARGEDGGDVAADAGFTPSAAVVLGDGAGGIAACVIGHAGDGDALFFEGAGVVGEEEVEEAALAVEDDGEIAVAAGEEAVFGVAIDGVAGIENDAEVADGFSIVVGDGGTDARAGKFVGCADAAGFVVVPEEERAIRVPVDGFKPYGLVVFGVEVDVDGVGEGELIGAVAAGGDAGGMEDIELAIEPGGCGITVDDFRENATFGGLDVGVLGEGGEGEN